MTNQQQSKCAEILEHYGMQEQIKQAAQECCELGAELLKHATGRHNEAAVVSEIADVLIMAQQMALAFGRAAVMHEIDRKLDRQLQRIEAELKRRCGHG